MIKECTKILKTALESIRSATNQERCLDVKKKLIKRICLKINITFIDLLYLCFLDK